MNQHFKKKNNSIMFSYFKKAILRLLPVFFNSKGLERAFGPFVS